MLCGSVPFLGGTLFVVSRITLEEDRTI